MNKPKRIRRTNAQIAYDNRAAQVATVAAPIARLRAARRAARDNQISESAKEVVTHMIHEVGASFTEAARELEHMGFRTPRGNLRWTATQAEREYKRPYVDEIPAPILSGRGRGGRNRERVPRYRAGETRAGGEARPWTKAEDARRSWWLLSTHRPLGETRPPEPLLDSRGRPLKGRRFSKIRKKPG